MRPVIKSTDVRKPKEPPLELIRGGGHIVIAVVGGPGRLGLNYFIEPLRAEYLESTVPISIVFSIVVTCGGSVADGSPRLGGDFHYQGSLLLAGVLHESERSPKSQLLRGFNHIRHSGMNVARLLFMLGLIWGYW